MADGSARSEARLRVESVKQWDEGEFTVMGFSLLTRQACFTGIEFNSDGTPYWFSWKEQKTYPLTVESLQLPASVCQPDLFGALS